MSENEKKEEQDKPAEAEAKQDQATPEAAKDEASVVQEAAEKSAADAKAEETAPAGDAEAKADAAAADEAPEAEKAQEEAAEPEPQAQELKEPEEHTVTGMIGRKLGMTQIFDRDGNVIPVTIVEVGPCTVVDVSEESGRLILGFGDIKESRTGKPRLGLFKKAGTEPRRILREFVSSDTTPYKVGMQVSARVFRPGDYVDVSGTSIGKGFQGGMKRHGWSGGPGGHGSMHHRRVGSIGMSADPSRTIKGRTMPGQMGNKRVTTQGLRVMEVDVDNNIALLKGAVPGHKNGIITVHISRKKKWRDLNEVKAVVQHKVNPMKQSKAKAGAKKKGK